MVVVGAFLINQIFKKREIEQNLSELQIKVRTNDVANLDYYSLGVIYLSKKLFDQAIIQFRYSLKTWDKKDIEGLANLYNTIGFTYSKTNQYDLAIYYYVKAIKCVPTYVIALNNLGYAYEEKQAIKKAIEIYKEVIRYEENNTTAKEKIKKLSKRIIDRDDRI